MREIPLSRGMVALVDDADYERLAKWRWSANRAGSKVTWYARRSEFDHETQLCRGVSMHRELMGFPDGMQVDHIDGNGLNNCRSNLRVCTRAQNLKNKKTPRKRSKWASQYKGVFRSNPANPSRGGWKASIMADGVTYGMGGVFFNTEEEAARAYDRLAVRYHGEFARLNFPDEKPEPYVAPVVTGPKYKCGDCGQSFWACSCAPVSQSAV